jgi:hypothetical protein
MGKSAKKKRSPYTSYLSLSIYRAEITRQHGA